MKITGGCHCGAITYEAEVDAERVALCHCTDCQTLSGSAFRSVGTVHQRAELLPKRQVWRRSAQGWTQHIEPITQIQTQDF